jgi:glucosylceramidase
MKQKLSLLLLLTLVCTGCLAQKINWIFSTENSKWQKGATIKFIEEQTNTADIIINTNDKLQQIDGFGGCFNELGWEALLSVSKLERDKILNDLFSKDGSNFQLCRVPIGSNDYSLSYFSYNDVPEDFVMRNFNIDRDRYILIPYIKAAKMIAPNLKIWGSPWSPPAWMKVNNHYSMSTGSQNQWASDMVPGKKISNNATAFKMEDRYLEAYALYFSKYVQAYQKEGIEIARICTQNEIVYQPHWPSCTWRPEDLTYFIGKFLGPRFKSDNIASEIWLGTINGADPDYMRRILNDKDAASYIKGIGMQWDAKQAIGAINKEYPSYRLMQTESECGNGENNWASAEYTWSLIKQYLGNGANSYMYWNMVLDNTGRSTWGWVQNTLISIDKKTAKVTYNPEYYLMKHLSHFVEKGAYLLKTNDSKNHLAFINPDGTIVMLIINSSNEDKTSTIKVGEKVLRITTKAKSFNTLSWK